MKGIFGTGTRDFLLVRSSALLMASYVIFIFTFILLHSPMEYLNWKNLFNLTWMKILTSVFMLSFAVHTWVGTWAIGSDYLTSSIMGSLSKPINFLYSFVTKLIIVSVLLWSLIIIW